MTGLVLLDLPNEVLFQIINRTRNADLDSFTSTCKLIRKLAASVLQDHGERKKTYGSITYGDPNASKNNGRMTWIHPTLMLRDLLLDDLLSYPSELSINYNFEWYDGRLFSDSGISSEANYQSEVYSVLETFSEDVGPLVQACPYVNGDEELTSAILKEGNIGATLGLLLNVLPNLTHLEITDYDEESASYLNLKQILDRMARARNDRKKNNEKTCTQPVCKLRHITFTRSDKGILGDSINLARYAALFYFPSVRFIRVEYLRNGREIWNYPAHHSHIEGLDFYDPQTNIESLETYVKDIQSLRHFRYHTEDDFTLLRFCMEPIVQKLLRYAGHSLRRLDLRDGVYDVDFARAGGRFIGSLKAFQVLETVRIGDTMFIESVKTDDKLITEWEAAKLGRPRQLIDMLPSSIVRILIHSDLRGPYLPDPDVAIAMLENLPERKVELLPNLETVDFEYSIVRDEEGELALLRACREAGVEIRSQDKQWE